MRSALEVEHLSKLYPQFMLRDLSFRLEGGYIMGIIGHAGAGKTTTLRCIAGLTRPNAGLVRCLGMEWEAHEMEIRQRIAYSPSEKSFFPGKTVSQIMEATRPYYAGWDEEASKRWIRRLEIDVNKTPSQLGKGMRVTIQLLLAMSRRAELVLLDEPTAGLNSTELTMLMENLNYLRQAGCAVLFTTETASDLDRCADDIVYLRDGQLVSAERLVDFVNYRRIHGFGDTLEKIMRHYEEGDIS